ncbi:MAG: hypothetical protein D6780_07835, partial [Candidatus Dadabacteria bacterium]
ILNTLTPSFTKLVKRAPVKGITFWREFVRHDLLLPADKKNILEVIINTVQKEKSAEKRRRLIEAVFSDKPIEDPVQRQLLVSMWAQSLKEIYGIDDGSSDYFEKLKETALRINKNVNRYEQKLLFSSLARAVEAQDKLANYLRDTLYQITDDNLKSAPLAGILSEASLLYLSGSKQNAEETLNFLLSPLSNRNIKRFCDLLYEYVDVFVAPQIEISGIAYGKEGTLKDRLLKDYGNHYARTFWENFWSAPLGVRALFAKELLLGKVLESDKRSTSERYSEETQEALFDIALNRAFVGDSKYSKEATALIKSYVKVLPFYQRHLALAAIMVGASPFERKEKGKQSVGETLAVILEHIGPAETVAGQNAASHPNTPLDLAEPLQRLKYAADEPERWEITKLVTAIKPALEKQLSKFYGDSIKISHIGEVVGSASLAVVVRIHLSNGKNLMLSIRRPYAFQRAKSGFKTMKEFIAEIGTEDNLGLTIAELIDQSYERLSLETNFKAALFQYQRAQEIYNNLLVRVGDYNFTFQAASVLTAGEVREKELKDDAIGYFVMEEMTGTHFLALPEENKEELERKKAIALAILTVEFRNILRGAFDCDRHGAQLKVQGNTIKHFDFKAMRLEEWDREGIEQFGEFLTSSFLFSSNLRDISMSLINFRKSLRERGKDAHPFIVEVQKALLSLGDYARYLTARDLKRAIVSALAAGIHNDLKKVILEKASPFAKPALKDLLEEGKVSPLLGIRDDEIIEIKE